MGAAANADRGALARAIAVAAVASPGVTRLVAGPGEPVEVRYPGGVVTGVGLGSSSVAVHVAVHRYPVEPVITGVVSAVSAVLAGAGDPRRVEVVVEEVEGGGAESSDDAQREADDRALPPLPGVDVP
ncbi:MAG: hypothetical protein WCA46_22655 [Actinocatenispora sp.]